MVRFLVQRGIRSVVTLWIVVSAVFVVLNLSGDQASIMLGPDASPAALDAFRAEHGLDDPLPQRYATYLLNLV